ncbi:MAG: S8/S53 family peptidase [Deltaproteobacteria bacterium]|nr:S8/S53 family peptidase [Nannocystaceae bacterium]
MMTSTRGYSLASLALLAACSLDAAEDAQWLADGTFRAITVAQKNSVCPVWRQVVRRTEVGALANRCPTVGLWTGTPLFEDLPGGLPGRYCVYEYTNDTPTPKQLETLTKNAKTAEAGADCLAMMPQAQLRTTMNPLLQELTADRLDLLSETDLDLDDTDVLRDPVVVATADSVPDDEPAEPRSEHGVIVAELIEHIAHGCENGSCPVDVHNSLALPRYGTKPGDVDLVNGGFQGFQSETARGLRRAVRGWEAMITPAYRPRLVINLSIAWLPFFGGALSPGPGGVPTLNAPPAVDAIELAIAYASCRRALTIASAGNAADDCEEGPMLPAAWEQMPAPSAARCLADFGLVVADSLESYAPLLYSVGAVGLDGEASSISREAGRPRLAALGDHVVGGQVTTNALTGTSMATAAVSGFAALLWSYNRDLDPHRVMRRIYEAGRDTDDPADYGLFGAPAADVHQVTACSALEHMCATEGGCPFPALACDGMSLSTEALDDAILGYVPDEEIELGFTETDEPCELYCEQTNKALYASGAPDSCPVIEGVSRVDYLVKETPPNPGCSACKWTSSGPKTTVSLSIAPEFQLWDVVSAKVDFKMTSGGSIPVVLGAIDLPFGETKDFPISPSPTGTIESGKITLTFEEQSTGALVTTTDALLQPTFFTPP